MFSSAKLSIAEKKVIQSFIDDCKLVQFTPGIQDETIDIRQQAKMKFPDAAIAASAAYMGIQLVNSDKSLAKVKDFTPF